MSAKEIFISYAWGGESETIVDQLDQTLQEKGLMIIRDKRDLGFKGRIKDFMKQIGRGKAVIVVISEKYLKSENCMFELLQIAENGQFHNRIFPIVLADANIYKPVHRLRYVKYWEEQIAELDTAMKDVGAANLKGIREDIDLYTEIRETIAGLVDILKDMNTLTPEMHRESGFQELLKAIEHVMGEMEEAPAAVGHILHQYPRGPMVETHRISFKLIEAYAEAFQYGKASVIIDEANRYRKEADVDDPRVTLIKHLNLPPVDHTRPFNYWSDAFNQACLNGPRMLAALLLVVPDTQFPLEVQTERQKLLDSLRGK